jgi:DNA-binding MarR family transcriptional regulator
MAFPIRNGWPIWESSVQRPRDICAISPIEKTKVSRVVAGLEQAAMLSRAPSDKDRRADVLPLTIKGQEVFAELCTLAVRFDQQLRQEMGDANAGKLTALLRRLMALSPRSGRNTD